MSNFEIEEIPMNEPQPKTVTSDLNNVIKLETPLPQNTSENCSDSENLENDIINPLQNDINTETFEIQSECKGHKFFGNITKKRIEPSKQGTSNLGLYLISGALIATIGAKLI